MNLPVGLLPSKGEGYSISTISAKPLTYRQLIEYSKDPSITQLQRLKRDIIYLLSDLPGYKDFNLYDLKALILFRKMISISFESEISTEVIGSDGVPFKIKFKWSDLKFEPVSPSIQKIKGCSIGGSYREFIYPATIGKFEEVLDTFIKRNEDIDIRFVYLCTAFNFMSNPNEIKSSIENATYDEVVLLETVYLYITGGIKDQVFKNQKGEEVRVGFDNLILDTFRTLLQIQRFDPKKITVE